MNSGERTTPVLAEELARRARFATVAAAVAARKKDLSKVTTDTANFLAQRNAQRKKDHEVVPLEPRTGGL